MDNVLWHSTAEGLVRHVWDKANPDVSFRIVCTDLDDFKKLMASKGVQVRDVLEGFLETNNGEARRE